MSALKKSWLNWVQISGECRHERIVINERDYSAISKILAWELPCETVGGHGWPLTVLKNVYLALSIPAEM